MRRNTDYIKQELEELIATESNGKDKLILRYLSVLTDQVYSSDAALTDHIIKCDKRQASFAFAGKVMCVLYIGIQGFMIWLGNEVFIEAKDKIKTLNEVVLTHAVLQAQSDLILKNMEEVKSDLKSYRHEHNRD